MCKSIASLLPWRRELPNLPAIEKATTPSHRRLDVAGANGGFPTMPSPPLRRRLPASSSLKHPAAACAGPRDASGAITRRVAAALLSLVLSSTVWAAGYFRSFDPWEQLRMPAHAEDSSSSQTAYQQGYVAGVADSVRNIAWCPPVNLGTDQEYDIVSDYLKDHSPAANHDALAVITAALRTRYPCGQR
jgi:hypothetical protein